MQVRQLMELLSFAPAEADVGLSVQYDDKYMNLSSKESIQAINIQIADDKSSVLLISYHR